MSLIVQELGLDQMSIEDRLVVAEAIWDSVTREIAASQIPASQLTELKRRLSDSIARPDAVVPWEQVKAKAIARART